MGLYITPILINLFSIPLYIVILLYNIICMLLITLVIASITLIERKVLSLIQRRVGPHYVGYRGRLQYIADALKLFIKGIVVPEGSNKF
jgi:NADH-quinone oxidoreductase subunit H